MSKSGDISYGKGVGSVKYDHAATLSLYGETYVSLLRDDEDYSQSDSVYDIESFKVEYKDFSLCEINDVPRLLRLTHEPPSTEINDHILREKCANPAIFYPMLEETNCKKRLDEISRVKHPVAIWNRRDPFTEDNVAHQFLTMDPVSFFILGKPELGQTEVARLLSLRWKCVDLNPHTVVQDEIKLGTRIGKCFEFNLKCGRPIRSDVILRLIEKRVKTETAQHRGFVLSGFPIIFDEEVPKLPLITESAMLVVAETLEDILPSEETLAEIFLTRQKSEPIAKQRKSVAFVKEVFEIPGEFGEEVFGEQVGKRRPTRESIADEEIAEEEEKQEILGEGMDEGMDDLLEGFDMDMYEQEHEWTLADDIDIGDTSQVDINKMEPNLWKPADQMKFLFDLFNDDFIMVYMSCDNLDAIQMRLNPYIFSEGINQKTAGSASTTNTVASKRHSVLFPQPVYLTPTLNKTVISKIIYQYNMEALPVIERRALRNRAEYFIKVDARLPPARINEIILTRLKILAIPPIILPELLKYEPEQQGENIDEESMESELQASHKHFEQLRYQHVVSPMYRLTLSNWNYKCPVATSHGIIVKGRCDKAVKFMSKIFFLSNDEAVLRLYRNPRSYLMSLAELPCKVWIFGPDCSGRTALAESLARTLGGVVVNPERLKQIYKKQERIKFREEISAMAIKEALQEFSEIREKEKKDLIKRWVNKARNLLIQVLTMYSKDYQEEYVIGEECPKTLTGDQLIEELQSMNLPEIDQIDLIKQLLENEEELSKYMPYTLLEPLNEIDAFHPFVVSYVDNVLQSTPIPEVEITASLYASIIKQEILKVENDHYRIFEKKPTVFVDGMPIDLDVLEEFNYKAFPDYTICLKDNDHNHSYLVDRFINSNDEYTRKLRQHYMKMRQFETVNLGQGDNHLHEDFYHHLEQPREYNSTDLNSDTSLTKEISKIYAENIEQFNAQWNISCSYFSKKCTESPFIVDVTSNTSEEIVDEVRTWLENRFRQWAVFMTEERKQKEKEDFIKSMAPSEPSPEVPGEGEEELEGEGKETNNWNELFAASRRLGNTGIYCPVAYNLYSVLWKGKEEFTTKFKERYYFMSNKHALDLFLKSPYYILQPSFVPTFPPPRILIFGADGSGKTTLAQYLSDELKLYHLHMETFIMKLLNIEYLNDLSEALTNENVNLETRQLNIIRDYLNGDGKVAEETLKVILNSIWHEEPYKTVGFILEGFPRKKSELDMMVENYFIPDVVIELYVTQNDAQQRNFPLRMQAWKDDLDEKQCKRELEKSRIYNQWRHEKSISFDFLMNQKKEERVKAAMEATEKRLLPTPESSHISIQSVEGERDPFFYNYTEDEKYEDMMEVEEMLKKDFPEPHFHDEWEKETDAADRIRKEIDEKYLKEISDLDVLRPEFLNANIEHELIDTSGKPNEYVENKSFEIVERYMYRDPAIFDSVLVINTSLAEKLLEDGYFFLSKFGRLCPVQVFEKTNPIHMYVAGQETNAIHTLLHRRYIYFVYGEENSKKFKHDPVKYVMNDDIEFPLLPLRIAIIGPPKCGKSTLAKRFGEDYGLQVITRGGAIRYVLDRFPDGELSQSMRFVLEKGWCLTDEMVARAVEALTLDGASVYQGYILDGFPLTVGEMKHLSSRNIIPFAVLDIEANLEKVKECSESFKKDDAAYTYSFEYTKSTYGFWARNRSKIRDWLRTQYQNIYTLDASKSKWHLWDEARTTVFSVLYNFHGYLKHSKYNSAHLINSLCVNSQEFEVRQSHFKNFCPCCLLINKLHYRESTPDWKNIVLYGNCYYAICSEHVQAFLDQPYKYLPPINTAKIPEHIPQIVSEVDMERIHQDGFCIVSFWDSMPKCNLVKGDPSIAARFRKRYCLFCSEECRTKFMQFPMKYFDKKIHFRKMNALSLCELNKLPTMGYLEQLVAAQLTEALVKAEAERPFCPGLGIQLSVLLYIGFYLKLHNPNTREEVLPFMRSAFQAFLERSNMFHKALSNFKSLKNPYKKIFVRKVKIEF